MNESDLHMFSCCWRSGSQAYRNRGSRTPSGLYSCGRSRHCLHCNLRDQKSYLQNNCAFNVQASNKMKMKIYNISYFPFCINPCEQRIYQIFI